MPGGERQCQQPLAHDRQHRLLLRHFVARMDRRQLDRDAGVAADVGAAGAAVQRRDRVGIGAMVAQRVGLGARRLAEHVVGIEIALGGHRAAAPHGLLDGAAEHELLAHLAHRRRDRGADHRLAEPAHHRAQRAFDAALAFVEHLAGEHQRPGRGVDEDRARAAGMRRPVVRRDLVADQIVHRRRRRERAAAPRPGTSAPRLPWSTGRRRRGTPPSAADRTRRAPRAPVPPRGPMMRGAPVGGKPGLGDQALQRLVLGRQVVGAHRRADRIQFAGHRRPPRFEDDCPDQSTLASRTGRDVARRVNRCGPN